MLEIAYSVRVRPLPILLLCVACTRTLTIEVEGAGRVGEKVRHGPGEIGTIQSVSEPDEEGLSRHSVSVAKDYIVPQGACAYAVGGTIFIRGSDYESTTDEFIPNCREGELSLESIFEGFFEEVDQQAVEGADFRDQLRQTLQPHAQMAKLRIPERKPDTDEVDPEPNASEAED